ncbi:hypothetical protein MKX01_008045 [Papaver californicum]|nr:hypothetical protein MKX01_008045 [Papaver californicum]
MNKNTLFFTIAIIMRITIFPTIIATMQGIKQEERLINYVASSGDDENESLSSISTPPKGKRISRFLNEVVKPPPLSGILLDSSVSLKHQNPRAASHCNKNEYVCHGEGSPGSTCCNNKCVDLMSDPDNCGACKSKCKFYTNTCCDGKCVNVFHDEKHCGRCNNKCINGGLCLYGYCNYA